MQKNKSVTHWDFVQKSQWTPNGFWNTSELTPLLWPPWIFNWAHLSSLRLTDRCLNRQLNLYLAEINTSLALNFENRNSCWKKYNPYIFSFILIFIYFYLGGLDLSRRGLDQDSRSRHRKKVKSWLSRKSQQFQKVSLDDRDISIEIEKSQFCLDTTFQYQKSEPRPRNLSRHDIFGKSRQFVLILIES